MKFYTIDNALQEAIQAADKPIKLKIEIQINGHFETVFEQDIVEANFYGLKEASGGTASRGEVLINNEQRTMTNEGIPPGSEVRVSFSIGEGLPYFQRFIFYIDDKGVQDIRGPGHKRYVIIGLQDLSYKLRKIDEARDWSSPAVFTYSVICDKTQPEKSLVHGISQRAGMAVTDIDCSTIPVTLPYVKLRKNIWSELSSLAAAYRCHLECPVEKPLVFAHSPYQIEPLAENDYSHTFNGKDIFYFRTIARAELYKNSVRLKMNMPVVLERQEIWRYEDQPVFYDDDLKPYYPFRQPLVRVIEITKYGASYMIHTASDKKRNVVFADEIDTKEEAESRFEYEGGGFYYSHYDVTTHFDKAVLTLRKNFDSDLFKAAIFGRPIVVDQNRSCFLNNAEEVAAKGTAALNVTGAYFSEYAVNGKPHYEDWADRELAERLQQRREFTIKTHRGLFNARVGAKVKIQTRHDALSGVINALSFRYKRNEAFTASFRVIEEGGSNAE